MDHVLIVGIDSAVGAALAEHLVPRSHVSGLTFVQSPVSSVDSRSISTDAIADLTRTVDAVIFCGGASKSSWDPERGDLTAEDKWLSECLQAAATNKVRFALVSTDAVFGGPWVFHDDDSESFADTELSATVRRAEAKVSAYENSLIVRTNVATYQPGRGSFVQRIHERIEHGECEHIDAATFATPISAPEFSRILAEALAAGMTGCVNIAGAERTTPWHFATALAAMLSCDAEHLVPRGDRSDQFYEQSLRCVRLRRELRIRVPALQKTLKQVALQITGRRKHPVAA